MRSGAHIRRNSWYKHDGEVRGEAAEDADNTTASEGRTSASTEPSGEGSGGACPKRANNIRWITHDTSSAGWARRLRGV